MLLANFNVCCFKFKYFNQDQKSFCLLHNLLPRKTCESKFGLTVWISRHQISKTFLLTRVMTLTTFIFLGKCRKKLIIFRMLKDSRNVNKVFQSFSRGRKLSIFIRNKTLNNRLTTLMTRFGLENYAGKFYEEDKLD